jgi:hypothetical protein
MLEARGRERCNTLRHHFRVRNRFLRLWLCTQKILIQELIPQLREEGQYRASITRVCPQLPFDSGLDG